MDCVFCAEFIAGSDRIIASESNWVLLPAMGCFIPGYCLFMPFEHSDSAAELPTRTLGDVHKAIERMRSIIESSFGPTIVAEHGSYNCELGAGCCTHCHFHLIPVANPDAVTAAYQLDGGPGRQLASLAALNSVVDGPYLYLSPRPGEHYLWAATSSFPRQYVRRVCAGLHGLGDYYDWRDYPFSTNQMATLDILRVKTSSPDAGVDG